MQYDKLPPTVQLAIVGLDNKQWALFKHGHMFRRKIVNGAIVVNFDN